MSAPLVVNTADGMVWTRREGTRGGEALYAPEKCGQCPQFVMATLTELAEHGIAGTADVLPVPVGSEPSELERSRSRFAEAVATVARQAVKIAQLERIADAERARVVELEAEPLAWAWKLDAKSLDNFLIALGSFSEHEPMDEAIDRIHELLRSYREATSVDGITWQIVPVQALREEAPLTGRARLDASAAAAAEATHWKRLGVEDPHDSPLHHDYRVPRDLPETGGMR